MADFERESDDFGGGGGYGGGYGGGRSGGGFGGRGGMMRRPKVCFFCTEKIRYINYKGTDILRRFLTDSGKIRPRRQTGACAKHQRGLAVAVKRARHMAMLPYDGDMGRD